ncbi:MAG: molybdopterin-binding protein [Sulfolobaceae archaeon]
MRVILKDEELLLPIEALNKFKERLPPKLLEIEEVNLEDALGRVLAEDIESPIHSPPFSRSTVDGFAIRSVDTPGRLRIIGKIEIGEYSNLKISKGEAVEVDTGSMIPEGADAVVKVEDVVREGDYIVINKKVNLGSNIAWIGSDIPKGFIVAFKGTILNPQIISSLASLGIRRVKVFRKPKVAVIITGNELIEPGSNLIPGKVYETNSFYLISKLKEMGAEVVRRKVVRDNLEEIKRELLDALRDADIVIATGGSSAGERDFLHHAIRELGNIIVHGLKFKPGKPTILAEINNKPVFGLPGNPVSTLMIFEELISKYLKEMMGIREEKGHVIKAKLVLNARADPKRVTYQPVYVIKGDDGSFYAIPIPFDSYMINTFSLSDGFIVMNPNEEYKEGQEVNVVLKKPIEDRPVVVGEESSIMKMLEDNFKFRILPIGSLPAYKLLKNNAGDVFIISSLMYNLQEEYSPTKIIKRKILVNGEGAEIGYFEWIGLSKLVKNPTVRLRYVSLARNFIGKAKVVIPEDLGVQGEYLLDEELYIIVRNKGLRIF